MARAVEADSGGSEDEQCVLERVPARPRVGSVADEVAATDQRDRSAIAHAERRQVEVPAAEDGPGPPIDPGSAVRCCW